MERNYPQFVLTKLNKETNQQEPTGISTTELAQYIRDNKHFFYIAEPNSEHYRRYFYIDGVYKLISDIEFKGLIKEPIEVVTPQLVKMSTVNEVFGNLITDRRYISEERLNADENIINFKNGILNLNTMQLLQHSPDIFSTIQLDTNYNGEQPTPIFDSYLDTLTEGDEQKKQALLEYMGACFSNIKGSRFKQALFLVGKGDSGKSALRKLVDRLIGIQNQSAGDLVYLESQFGKFGLYGKRIFGSSDLSYLSVQQLTTFKSITGGDIISVEQKGKDAFDYEYKGLIWFGCNELPKFGGDRGDWVYNRILPISCNKVIPKEEQDKKLVDKMLTEGSGIVYKALIALKQAIERGYKFTLPEDSEKIIKQYKTENSPYLAFYEECCCSRPSNFSRYDSVTVGVMHDILRKWCSANFGNLNVKTQDFRKELEQNGIGVQIVKNNMRYYANFTLNLETKKEYHIADSVCGDSRE